MEKVNTFGEQTDIMSGLETGPKPKQKHMAKH